MSRTLNTFIIQPLEEIPQLYLPTFAISSKIVCLVINDKQSLFIKPLSFQVWPIYEKILSKSIVHICNIPKL
jgi:hypothetical protein